MLGLFCIKWLEVNFLTELNCRLCIKEDFWCNSRVLYLRGFVPWSIEFEKKAESTKKTKYIVYMCKCESREEQKDCKSGEKDCEKNTK